MEIKYRFALDKNGNLIDVSELSRKELSKEDKFYSIDFHNELIPKLGDVVTKHFAHKGDSEGNYESYLHALAKKVFADEYQKCLNEKTPFLFKYRVDNKCSRLDSLGVACIDSEYKLFDLTTKFDQLFIEKRDGHFIPDVMLYNSEKGDKIYIEIAVTHFCEEDKINSGNRIVEFSIQKEDDISNILEFKDGKVDFDKIKYYNFKSEKEYTCQGNCGNKFACLSVNKDDTIHYERLKGSEINVDNLFQGAKRGYIAKTTSIQSETDDMLKFIKAINSTYKNVVTCLNCDYYNLENNFCRRHFDKNFKTPNHVNINAIGCNDFSEL